MPCRLAEAVSVRAAPAERKTEGRETNEADEREEEAGRASRAREERATNTIVNVVVAVMFFPYWSRRGGLYYGWLLKT